MKNCLLLGSVFFIFSAVGFAADDGLVSTNASGDEQITVVDANGNLKMVPAKPSDKPSDKQAPAPSVIPPDVAQESQTDATAVPPPQESAPAPEPVPEPTPEPEAVSPVTQ